LAGTSDAMIGVPDLYREAVEVLRADPGKFLILSAIGLAPSWIASLLSGSFLVSIIVLIVSLPIVALANGAIVMLVTTLRNGVRMPLAELLSGPRDGFLRLTIAYVLLSVVLGIGFVLLLVPGLVALAFLWVAWPLVVLEEANGIDAMKRSVAMVDGLKSRILLVVLVLIAIYIVLGVAQVIVVGILGEMIGLLLGALIGIAINSMALTLVTLSYHRIKAAAAPSG
jgi:hypothetical protein